MGTENLLQTFNDFSGYQGRQNIHFEIQPRPVHILLTVGAPSSLQLGQSRVGLKTLYAVKRWCRQSNKLAAMAGFPPVFHMLVNSSPPNLCTKSLFCFLPAPDDPHVLSLALFCTLLATSFPLILIYRGKRFHLWHVCTVVRLCPGLLLRCILVVVKFLGR